MWRIRSQLLILFILIQIIVTLVPFVKGQLQVPFLQPSMPKKRIAVVGAGAGGSAACYFFKYDLNVDKILAEGEDPAVLVQSLDSNFDVTLYERSDYIGGRSTILPIKGDPRVQLELGASIFVTANKHLHAAVKVFNLEIDNKEIQTAKLGVWNGERLVYTESNWKWWNYAKMLWSYGYSPVRTGKIVTKVVDTFLQIYNPQRGPWQSIESLSTDLGLSDLTNQTAEEYLINGQGLDARFIHEFVDGATRVNYGQNVDSIHALEGVVSLAGAGGASVRNGNRQIFEAFARRSGAKIRLSTEVVRINKTLDVEGGGGVLYEVETKDGSLESYDAVIIAAPMHSTNIEFINMPGFVIPKVDYVHLHVTFLTTKGPAEPTYFNLPPGDTAPDFIITSSFGDKRPAFNSLTRHHILKSKDGQPEEHVWKMFSAERASDELLDKIMGPGNVTWIYRHEWDAYPMLPPTTEFPAIRPDPDERIYHINAMESFISTMETETVSAKNVVRLIRQKWPSTLKAKL